MDTFTVLQTRHIIILAVAGILVAAPFVVALSCVEIAESVRWIWLLASYVFFFLWSMSIGAAASPRPDATQPDIHIARRMVNAALGLTMALVLLLISGTACMFGLSYAGVILAVFLLLIMSFGLHVGQRFGCPQFFR